LKPSERRKLAQILGHDRVDVPSAAKAIAQVEKWLGFYRGAVDATANAPRMFVKRGRPTSHPLKKVILELRRVFQKFYSGKGSADRTIRGAITSHSWREAEEIEFIGLALNAASIPRPQRRSPTKSLASIWMAKSTQWTRPEVRRYLKEPGLALDALEFGKRDLDEAGVSVPEQRKKLMEHLVETYRKRRAKDMKE